MKRAPHKCSMCPHARMQWKRGGPDESDGSPRGRARCVRMCARSIAERQVPSVPREASLRRQGTMSPRADACAKHVPHQMQAREDEASCRGARVRAREASVRECATCARPHLGRIRKFIPPPRSGGASARKQLQTTPLSSGQMAPLRRRTRTCNSRRSTCEVHCGIQRR